MLNSRPANILLDADGTPKMADFGLLLSWKGVGFVDVLCFGAIYFMVRGCSGLKTKALQQL